MQPVECEFEADVLAAVVQSRWPERADVQLVGHTAGCQLCSDVAAVAGIMEESRESAHGFVALPDSGRVWWLAQLRARRDAAQTAARPITITKLLTVACAVGLLGACFGATSAWFQDGLSEMKASFGGLDLTALLAEHMAFALGLAAILFLIPTAAWLVLRKE